MSENTTEDLERPATDRDVPEGTDTSDGASVEVSDEAAVDPGGGHRRGRGPCGPRRRGPRRRQWRRG